MVVSAVSIIVHSVANLNIISSTAWFYTGNVRKFLLFSPRISGSSAPLRTFQCSCGGRGREAAIVSLRDSFVIRVNMGSPRRAIPGTLLPTSGASSHHKMSFVATVFNFS